MNTSKKIDALLYLWYITFFVSMVCCFRSISSISIALLLITGLLKNKMDTGSWINMNVKNSFLLACSFFYLIQATGMLFTFPLHESMKDLQMKTAIIFVPLALCCSNYLDGQDHTAGCLKRRRPARSIWLRPPENEASTC